jgi:hypothetical protein
VDQGLSRYLDKTRVSSLNLYFQQKVGSDQIKNADFSRSPLEKDS